MLRSQRLCPILRLLLEYVEPLGPLDLPSTSTCYQKILNWPIWKPDLLLGKIRLELCGAQQRMKGQVLPL